MPIIFECDRERNPRDKLVNVPKYRISKKIAMIFKVNY